MLQLLDSRPVEAGRTYTQQTTEGGQRGETTPLGILNFSGTIALMLLSSFAAITAKVVFGEENHMENIQRLTHNIRETALYTADPLVGGIRFLQNKRRGQSSSENQACLHKKLFSWQ